MPLDVVEKVEGGRLRVRTPPDPRTGLADKSLDPLDLIHAVTTQIPEPPVNTSSDFTLGTRNRSRGARAETIKANARPTRTRKSRRGTGAG
jgi:hypothetical protein